MYYRIDTQAHIGAAVFILNPQSGIPLYRQLVEQVRRMVASGQLQPGAPAAFGARARVLSHAVNPMTVSKAYSQLEAEGLLERNRGKPMTVASQSRGHSQLPENGCSRSILSSTRSCWPRGNFTERGGPHESPPPQVGAER